jgi:hypothetical protein
MPPGFKVPAGTVDRTLFSKQFLSTHLEREMPTLLSKIDSWIGAVVPRIANVLLGSLSCKEIEALFQSWSHRSTNGSARGMSDIQEKL